VSPVFRQSTVGGVRAAVDRPAGRRRGSLRPASAGAHPAATPTSKSALFSVRLREIWQFFWQQPASYKLVCLYLFMEYVRPQQIRPEIAGPPYTKIIIAIAIVAFVVEGRSFRIKAPELMLGLFTAVLLASSAFAVSPDASLGELSLYLSWMLIYLLIVNAIDTTDRFLVFVFSFILYSFKMAQFGARSWAQAGFQFRTWGINGTPGWFSNSGEYAIQMCIFLPIVIYFIRSLSPQWPRWKRFLFWSMPVCAVIGIVGSSSRGGLVGLGAVAMWMLLKSRYKVRGLAGLTVLAFAVYRLIPPEQMARLQSMGDDSTSVSRTTMWARGLQMMKDHPFLGIGYANWSSYSALHFGSPLLSHNIFIQAGAELGYTGLVAFVALIVTTLVINHRTRRLARHLPGTGGFSSAMANGLDGALIGFLASGFFVTVLYYPFFWINFAFTVALYRATLAQARSDANRAIPSAPQPVRGTRRGWRPGVAIPARVGRAG
jgi:putative inorganic carbon (hco3(-)) transporter